MLKAILFDMDDTLLDWSKRSQDWQEYERQHLQLVYDYAKQVYLDVRTEHALTGSLDVFCAIVQDLSQQAWLDASQSLRAPLYGNVLRDALTRIGIPTDRIDVDACLQAYDWQPIIGVTAFADAGEVLPILSANKVMIGLITNAATPMWMRDLELAACGLLSHFGDCRLSAADVGFLKPHPAVFQTALDRLGVTASETVFVGDNPEADIAGAQNVGMKAVLRVGRPLVPMLSGLIVPDGAINSLHELLPILDEWYPGWRSIA